MSRYDCQDGKVLKQIGGGIDKYGNEIKSEYRCVAPTSVLDCPPNTRFYSPKRGIYTPAKCIPISNDGYDEGYGEPQNPIKGNPKNCEVEWIKELKFREKFGPSIRKTKPDETKEEFMARCQSENGIVITDPIKPIVDVIKPKTEEEEYRNFIFLTMAAVGVYLILSE